MTVAANEDIRKELENDHNVKTIALDCNGYPRGELMSKKKFISSLVSGFGLSRALYGKDTADMGYPSDSPEKNSASDVIMKPDTASLYRLSWEDGIPTLFLDAYDPLTYNYMPLCPRGLLKKTEKRFTSQLNATAISGCELEFQQFNETAHSLAAKDGAGLSGLHPSSLWSCVMRQNLNKEFYYGVVNACRKTGVELECWKVESGPSVLEGVIGCNNVLKLADDASMFKIICKSVGAENGIIPCFMAKPQNSAPGNSSHFHISIVSNNTGENLFARESPDPDPEWPEISHLSDFGRHFLAGILDGLTDVMPLLAPNINSYKRLHEKYYAPISINWGVEHRMASVRVICPPTTSSKNTRLEIRVPGADAVAHYALSAIMALGQRGVEKKIPLTIRPMKGDETSLSPEFKRLPKTLFEATVKFSEKGSIARELFGDEFVDLYARTRFHEVEKWNESVTNWDVNRYMEAV
ncbi:hypothetical protein TRICI_002149 [Trichomonascus ciferrii]|uniref:GS catalytic domain-containing protein n=1 Tax=Trichomonascus ciferrii TaxID=44093 RepID=A0A642V6L0_9ASCO|nr:hypothetical protein TRICI_002149 [Trichomonascus ciferrii]